jgi:hypothetical protein
MAQNAVRGRGVEVEIRECKSVEELLSLQRRGFVRAGGKADVARVCAVELRRLERLYVVVGFGEPLPQLVERLFGVGCGWHFAVRDIVSCHRHGAATGEMQRFTSPRLRGACGEREQRAT